MLHLMVLDKIRNSFNILSKKNGFIRNSFTLSLGTTIAQIIPILLSPVLARLFAPAEFGLLAILSSITAVINVISTGKYESVIYIADKKKDAGALVIISLSLSLITSFLITVLLLFFSDTVVGILKQPRLAHWIFICPLASFLISVYQCYNEWCVRNSSFTNLSVNKVVNAGSITLSSLFFGVAKLTQGGLILGDLTGRFISAASCTYWALRKDLWVFRQVTWLRINLLLKKYIECPKFVLPGQLLNTLAGQVSVFLIAALFNDTEVGYYSMTGVVLAVPASLISLSIRDVFRQRASEVYQVEKNCLIIYSKTVKTVSILSFIIFSILFIILPDFFSFFFGEKWRIAGEYARILCPTIMISFIAECVSGMFIVAKKMRAVLIWQTQFLFITVLSLFIGYIISADMKVVLICFAVGRSLVYLINLRMTFSFAKGQ